MIAELTVTALLLLAGNIVFFRFEPHAPLWRRVLKALATLLAVALLSHYFGRKGVLIGAGMALLPVVYVHGVWLPRNGVNGWTAEPKEKYYALRGWPLNPPRNEKSRVAPAADNPQ